MHHTDKAKKIVAKFKNLRRVLRAWAKTLSNLASVIANNKSVLLFLDTMEESRDLSVQEWNFIVREHLDKLLKHQLEYWKQRGKIKWVKLGDENTMFFHATATVQLKRKVITSLRNSEGEEFFSHEAKANLIWESFKERLGVSDFLEILFNLDDLIQPVEGLDHYHYIIDELWLTKSIRATHLDLISKLNLTYMINCAKKVRKTKLSPRPHG